jgi:RNase P subunit RPR2
MMGWFQKVIYTCQACGAQQRIPLRRIHFFERFHELQDGQAVLILCPICGEGLQIPTPYRGHAGHSVTIDPEKPLKNAVVHGS